MSADDDMVGDREDGGDDSLRPYVDVVMQTMGKVSKGVGLVELGSSCARINGTSKYQDLNHASQIMPSLLILLLLFASGPSNDGDDGASTSEGEGRWKKGEKGPRGRGAKRGAVLELREAYREVRMCVCVDD